MNIEVSEEMIERIVREEVGRRVNNWYDKHSYPNEHFMKDKINEIARDEVREKLNTVIMDTAKYVEKVAIKEIVKEVG